MTGGNADTNTEKYAYWADGVGYPAAGEEVTGPERDLAWVLGAPYGDYMTPIQSPFDYDHHSMIYYTNDMPHPTKDHEAFLTAGIKRLKEILDISEGRALVLFTSKADMRRTADELKRMEVPYNILVQTAGSSQEDIISVFRKDEHAVLK